MTNMTLAIPEDLHSIMKKHSDVKWSEVARQAIEKKAREFARGRFGKERLVSDIKNLYAEICSEVI